MPATDAPILHHSPHRDALLLALLFSAVAIFSARPYAGGWNDGSRLATVQSLVDFHTWQIDDSIFVHPRPGTLDHQLPYRHDDWTLNLFAHGTSDKLFIRGHWYSDKSPVPALPMAGIYWILRQSLGLHAAARPAIFCWAMALSSSGLAYVLAVLGIYRTLATLQIPRAHVWLLVCGFAFATTVVAYQRQVNSHILLTALVAWMAAIMARCAMNKSWPLHRIAAIGLLAGFGYTTDLGIGPVLILVTALWILMRTCKFSSAAVYFLAILPPILLHHLLNYHIGHTILPANAHAQYLLWPGSPFTPNTITGGHVHKNVAHLVRYALEILFSRHGFLGHNLFLLLAFFGAFRLLHHHSFWTPEIIWTLLFALGGWLLYAVTSNNNSGLCVSIRWFLPFCASGFFVLAILLKEFPRLWSDYFLLFVPSAILGAAMWYAGPWHQENGLIYWFSYAIGLIAWGVFRLRLRTHPQQIASASPAYFSEKA